MHATEHKLEGEVLKINKSWVPIGIITVRKAFEDAFAGAVTLLRFHDGYPTPYRIEDWIRIQLQDGEDYISVSRMHGVGKIAIPRVCITVNFNRIIAKEQRCNLKNLSKHYDYTCAVSGKKLLPDEYSREHVKPRAHGGGHGWGNEVLMDRRLNSRRGDRPYADLHLPRPKLRPAPRPLLPINTLVNRNHYPEWRIFGIRED